MRSISFREDLSPTVFDVAREISSYQWWSVPFQLPIPALEATNMSSNTAAKVHGELGTPQSTKIRRPVYHVSEDAHVRGVYAYHHLLFVCASVDRSCRRERQSRSVSQPDASAACRPYKQYSRCTCAAILTRRSCRDLFGQTHFSLWRRNRVFCTDSGLQGRCRPFAT